MTAPALLYFDKLEAMNRIALIDGKRIPYDMCSSELLTEYPRFTYVGKGTIHSINGVAQGDRIYTFFQRNW